MKRKNRLFLLFAAFFIVFVYKFWIFNTEIIGGDWPYFYQEGINGFNLLPPSWSGGHGNGLGGKITLYVLDSYLYFTGWFFSHTLHIPWPLVYKFFYFGMFLFVSLFSVWYSFKKFFHQVPLVYRLLGIFIYIANTYIFLVVSGGQMGVALAYAVAPLVLVSFIKLIDNLSLAGRNFQFPIFNFQSILKFTIIAGLTISIQVMFDLRIAYITLSAIFLYLLINYGLRIGNDGLRIKFAMRNAQLINWRILYALIIPLIITGLLHAFWLLPLLFTGTGYIEQQHGDIYTTAEAVKFFSFAKLENALSLLHPNWPENIFGKVSFMKAEFLILPILAYSSLLFINFSITNYALRIKKNDKNINNSQFAIRNYIIYFILLSLIGAFLAKGANEPFGFIYLWMFEHVPGFVMFRDPTKWYFLIALSYSVLIPFSIWNIYQWLKNRFDN